MSPEDSTRSRAYNQELAFDLLRHILRGARGEYYKMHVLQRHEFIVPYLDRSELLAMVRRKLTDRATNRRFGRCTSRCVTWSHEIIRSCLGIYFAALDEEAR